MRLDQNGQIALAYYPDSDEYRIGRDLVTSAQAVYLAERILKNANRDTAQAEPQTPEPQTPRGAISHNANEIIEYFSPRLFGLDFDDQEQFKALIRFKLERGGAMPSRRQLLIFMRPDLDPANVEDPDEKARLDRLIDQKSRTFTNAYERLFVAGLGSYRKNNSKRGSGAFRIAGEAWGVAIGERATDESVAAKSFDFGD